MNYIVRCHVVTAFVMGITVGPLTLLVFDRDDPFEIFSGRIIPPDQKPGGQVSVEWAGERHRDCPGTVTRRVIDAKGIVHMIAGVPAQYTRTVNPQPVVIGFNLPLAIAPGPYTYHATTSFVCNFTHRWWPIVSVRPVLSGNALPMEGGVAGPAGPAGPQGAQGEPGPAGPRGP